MSLRAKAVFEFGLFRLNPAERLLLREEVPVRLPPKAFDALVVLVENPGHLLDKEELLKKVWPDTFVEESNLAQHISILRRALQDGEGGVRYIETVPRRGYRFVAEVRALGGVAELTENVPPRLRSRRLAIGAAVLVVLLAVLIAIPLWKRLRGAGTETIQSLAVLPLRNLSGDPAQDYFAEGMTEALITDLARVPGLKVISRTSIMQYKDSRKQLPQIARELAVDGVVEGSVLRSGNQVRITAQLVRGATDRHIWAASYDRDLRDLVTLEDEVSRSIVGQIRRQIAPRAERRLAIAATVSPEAREDYLQGRYFWNRRSEAGYLKAIDYFRAAIADDAQYAQAYAGLADAYALLGSLPASKIPRDVAMPKAKETALAALNLDDSLADAHTSLAFVEMHYEWKFREAEQEFKRAIDLDSNYSVAHQWYALDLTAMGRMDESVAEIERARQTDPYSAIINTDMAETLYFARRYDEALEQARATVDMDPDFAHAHRVMERVFGEKHMYPEAIAEGKKAVALSPGDTWMLVELAHTYQMAGQKTEMQSLLKSAPFLRAGGVSSDTGTSAEIDMALGDVDGAFKALETLYRRREGSLILLNADPGFDRLKADPRFQQLLLRIGLPH
jgi:TolB-like protein/DNA-binding winged helix-turn-helix (wHTH) protein/tetratricopeptide (TPR) repeat protein